MHTTREVEQLKEQEEIKTALHFSYHKKRFD